MSDSTNYEASKALIRRSGQLDRLCKLVYSGHSNRKIAEMLGIASRTVDRFVKSPEFLTRYEEIREKLRSEVYNEVLGRAKDVMNEALRTKIDLMRSTKKETLRNLIASQLLEFGMDAFRGESGGEISQELQKVWERVRKTKTESGETVTETVRITGSAAKRADDAAGMRETPRSHGGSGSLGGEIGPEEA